MKYKKRISASDLQNNFLHEFNLYFMNEINLNLNEARILMKKQVDDIKNRADLEITYLKGLEDEIRLYDKEKAILELINSRKILQRQNAINQFIGGLDDANSKYCESSNSNK